MTYKDYQEALEYREQFDIYTPEWNKAQNAIDYITEKLIQNGDRRIAFDLADDIDSLYDCEGAEETVNWMIKLLKDNGFEAIIPDYVLEDERA